MKFSNKVLTGFFSLVLSVVFSAPIMAAKEAKNGLADSDRADTDSAVQSRVTELEQTDGNEGVLEEVITTGTRSAKPRSAADSTVPVDVISGDDFNAFGGIADLTDNLKANVPSYTATPATGDGSSLSALSVRISTMG